MAGSVTITGCFNEAGAFMPRKAPIIYDRTPESTASMRPGLLCPGRSPISAMR